MGVVLSRVREQFRCREPAITLRTLFLRTISNLKERRIALLHQIQEPQSYYYEGISSSKTQPIPKIPNLKSKNIRCKLANECISAQVIHQWDLTIVRLLLDRMAKEAGIEFNFNCSFVKTEKETAPTETDMKIAITITKKGGKGEERWRFIS